MTMFELADFIVSMWFFPVTIFIIIPLLMLIAWVLLKLIVDSRLTKILLKNSKV